MRWRMKASMQRAIYWLSVVPITYSLIWCPGCTGNCPGILGLGFNIKVTTVWYLAVSVSSSLKFTYFVCAVCYLHVSKNTTKTTSNLLFICVWGEIILMRKQYLSWWISDLSTFIGSKQSTDHGKKMSQSQRSRIKSIVGGWEVHTWQYVW